MEGKFTELELAFIDDQLDQHGEYVRDLLMDAIEAKKLISKGEDNEHLIDSIKWEVVLIGVNPHLYISFPVYGRFQDISGYKKSTNTDKWSRMNEEANRAILGMRGKKKMTRRRKDTRFYAKTVYGTLNTLIGKIMYEFTDYEMERMKKAILSGNNLRPYFYEPQN
jgi:hypothetical protein